jgi:hypothetical protein
MIERVLPGRFGPIGPQARSWAYLALRMIISPTKKEKREEDGERKREPISHNFIPLKSLSIGVQDMLK